MADQPSIFVSYSHADTRWLNELDPHLKGLSLHARVERFDDRQLFGGDDWNAEVKAALDRADIILLLVTANFIGSEYIQRVELPTALKRRQENGSVVVPVLVQDCARMLLAIDDINYLPKDPGGALKPLDKWRGAERNSGFRQVTEHVLAQIERWRSRAERDVKAVATSLGRPAPGRPVSAEHARALEQNASDATGAEPNREPDTARIPDKPEPPTRVVDALYRGDHATIVDALHSARPGDRILIRPGMYRENIIINKPVEIVGDAKIDDVIIETTEGTTVLCQTNMARIANLTLRQAGNGNYHCIDIAEGRLDLEECDITSQSQGRACVAIHDSADPRLRRNRIHDGKEGGVFVYANGKGTLEDNDIFANAAAGVAIMTGGNPTLRRNRIYDGEQSGVYVFGNGRGTLEDNEIFANTLAGVAITEGGNPTLRRNQIHDGNEIGVYVAANGRGTLEENDIFRNARAGVEIKTGGNPTLRRNRIYDGKQSGIYVYENGKGSMEENDIFANAGAGVEIREGGNPTLRRNRIHGGRRAGVLVRTNGRGSVEDNEIFANEGAGVEIRHNGNPSLRRNRIHDGNGAGVFVYDNGRGTLEENEIFANSGPGIETREGGNPILRRNRIHAGRGAGVLVRTNGQGSIEDNDILANASSGLEIRHGGKPSVRRNRILRNALHAIRVYGGGQGVFEDNDLRGNGAGAWDVSADCQDKVMRKHNQE
jgi:parallel beta-helix repeat protein